MRHGPGRATRATGLPLGVRFFLLLAGAAVVVTVLLVVVLAGLIWDRLESDVEDNALLLLSTLDWAVAPLLAVDDMASVQRLVESTGSDRSVRNLRVYDRSGTVLASNLLGEIGKPILEPALGDVFEKHTLRSIVEDFDRDEFALAVPVRGQKYVREQWTDINAAIFLRPNIRQQKQRFAPYSATVLLSAVATIVSAIALFTFMLYRWVLRPLSQLALATREVAAGNLSHRVREALPGELGSFATLFNAMLGELHQKDVALQGYTEELEARVTERTRSLSLTNFELAGAYTELKGAQSRLLQSEKMASVGQLAAGVAHEINNPTAFVSSNLFTLTGYLGKVREYISALEAGSEAKTRKASLGIDAVLGDVDALLSESVEGVERIKSIVQSLCDFAHVDTGEAREADINELLDGALLVAHHELKYKATIEKDYGELPPIICYPQRLGQVFLNLIVNAAQAIDTSGVIRLTTRYQNDRVVVKVRDNGHGIPEEIRGRILEPFFTTKDVGKGTGLGLSIAYEIVQAHHGQIEVWSEPGQGTEFTVTLRSVGMDATPEPSTAEGGDTDHGNGESASRR